MTRDRQALPVFSTGEAFTLLQADNENLPLLDGCALTPAELVQWARRRRRRLSRDLAADAGLWNCPEHRRAWDETIGIEEITLRQCFGIHGLS